MILIKLNKRYRGYRQGFEYALKFDSSIDKRVYVIYNYLFDHHISRLSYYGKINKMTKETPYYICFNGEKLATLLLMMV